MPIITDSDQQVVMPEISKEQLLDLYARLRRARTELYRSGNAVYLKSSEFELGQLTHALLFQYHVSPAELLYAVEVHS